MIILFNTGSFAKETPIEYANSLGLVETVQLIQQQISDIEKNVSTLSVAGASGIPGSMEKVDSERVQTAKERLIAFREKKVDEKS